VKRLIAFVAATAIFAFAATGTASAASSAKAPTLKQFNALSKKVTKLQKQVKDLETLIVVNFVYDVCFTAATADAFQGTWIFVNKGSSFPYFPSSSSSLDDLRACSDLRIQRQLPSTETPPSTGVFQALVNLFK
jgi:hypothetical protein